MPMDAGPVMIVNLSKRYGGAEVRVIDMAAAFHGRLLYSVAVLKDSPLHQRLDEAKLNVLPFSFSRGDPRILFSLIKAIRKNSYKVIDTHNSQSQFWGILAAYFEGLPVRVTTVHSSYRSENIGLKGRLYEQVLKLNARLKSHFIAVSQSVYDYLVETGVRKENISLIYNSIKLPEGHPGPKNFSLRESFGWDKDACVVIAVGRLEPVKGIRFLIDALSKVIRVRPNVRCLIVGEGRARQSLEGQVKSLDLGDYVYFAGFRRDVSELLSGSDIFCMPSLSEGLPYAMLEASAVGLPLLVSEVGEMARLLKDGENAVFVPPGDPEALAKCLIRLIDNPEDASRLGMAAFSMVRRKLSIKELITKTLEVYTPKDGIC